MPRIYGQDHIAPAPAGFPATMPHKLEPKPETMEGRKEGKTALRRQIAVTEADPGKFRER